MALTGALACRTDGGVRLTDVAGPSEAVEPKPAPALNCPDVAAKAKLSAMVTKDLCGSDDPENKAACILAATEALQAPAGVTRSPTAPLGSSFIGELCASSEAKAVGACIREARMASLISYDIDKLCRSGSPDNTACIVASNEELKKSDTAKNTPAPPLGTLTIVSICAAATPETAGCITSTRRAGLDSGSSYQACKAGGSEGHSAQCVAAANAELTKPSGADTNPTAPLGAITTTSLCGAKAGAGSAACITTARLAAFSESNIYTLCKSGDANSGPCIEASLRKLEIDNTSGFTPSPALSTFNVVGVCGTGNTHSAACIESARRTGVSTQSIASMCQKATASSAACIDAARPSRIKAISDLYTTTVCTKATAETVECVKKGLSDGKSATTIASQCEPAS